MSLTAQQQQAIIKLNSQIVTVRGDIAYDANNQEITYSKSDAEAKLLELEAQETTQAQADAQTIIDTKASALAKLTALGLSEDEVKALVG